MAKRLAKRDIGQILVVRFYDHASETTEPVYCEAVGWLTGYDKASLDKASLSMTHWRTPKDTDVDNRDADVAILRSTIVEIMKARADG